MNFKHAMAGLLLSTCAVMVNAAPIPAGGIDFAGGSVSPIPGGNWQSATGVDFNNTAGFYDVVDPSGVFVGADFSDFTLYDFSFDPFNTPTLFWTGADYTFNMLTLTVDAQGANGLLLSGTGILSTAGYDDTIGAWTFSANRTTGGGPPRFSFSGGTAVADADVPEPGILGLFGFSLLGLALVNRRRKTLAA